MTARNDVRLVRYAQPVLGDDVQIQKPPHAPCVMICIHTYVHNSHMYICTHKPKAYVALWNIIAPLAKCIKLKSIVMQVVYESIKICCS